jgi:hypothetical protein
MSLCNLFDKYRDGEMTAPQRGEFESHLAACISCREKTALLDNLSYFVKRDVPQTADLAGQIASRAFRQNRSWDALILSWIRPGPVLAALALAFLFISLVWIVPEYRQLNILSEYESFMDEAETINLSTSASQVSNDSDLVLWLQQEGNPQ